jgi:hypothetical protein
MKKNIFFGYFLTIVMLTFSMLLFQHCKTEDPLDTIDDAARLAALRKVVITYDSMSYEIGLPEGALSGPSFDELMAADSSKYANPENYTVTFLANMKADNTNSGAMDAKFDGMVIGIVMDTIQSSPIDATTGAFEVDKGEIIPVVAQSFMNLKTHRLPCLYIFRQVVDGEDLTTTLSPKLNYTIGSSSGVIPLPSIQKDIPTRASDQTKAFLLGLLESGVFDEVIVP